MDPQEPNQAGPSTPPKPTPAAEPASNSSNSTGDATMQEAPKEPQEEPLPQEILDLSADDILARARLIDNEIKVSFLASSHHRASLSPFLPLDCLYAS